MDGRISCPPGVGAGFMPAIAFSVIIGLLMHFFFRKEEMEKVVAQAAMPEPEVTRPLWQNTLYLAAMVAILVFANWGKPVEPAGLWQMIYASKWQISGLFAAGLGLILMLWYGLPKWQVALAALPAVILAFFFAGYPTLAFVAGVIGLSAVISPREDETGAWFAESWGFAKQILPLLLFGVLISGILLGRPGEEGLIPSVWVSRAVGGNSFTANFVASFAGAFMYFATLTEVPILQGLIGSGMGQGPALALLLAGPALSLPNMLVIRTIMGTRKTVVFVSLVIVMATFSGMIYGSFFLMAS
ncbi:MAG: permease [Deltaproteobacteria bacterium]|nr:permease [Deltaproteobacteria bacterium]